MAAAAASASSSSSSSSSSSYEDGGDAALTIPDVPLEDVEAALEAEAGNLFDEIDVDKNGAIDVNEAAKYFGIILRKDGEMPTLEMARRIATAAIDMADSNHDRALSKKEFASALIGTLRSGLAPVMKVHEAQHTIMLLSTVRHTIKELGAGYPTAAMIEELKMNVYARLHDVLDVDRSGDLDRSEVRRFLQLALLPSLYPPETDLESLTRERWDALDWNKDGRCDRSEWIRGMETLRADFHLSEVQMIGLIVGTFIPVIQDS